MNYNKSITKIIILFANLGLLFFTVCSNNAYKDRENFYKYRIDQLPNSYLGKWIRNGRYQFYKGLSNPKINTIIVDRYNPASVYAASADACIFNLCYDCSDSLVISSYFYMPEKYEIAYRNGFKKPGIQYIEHLAMDPYNTNVLYAAFSGIFKTKNGGGKWKQVYNIPRVTWIEIDSKNPRILYAGTDKEGLLKSIDKGNSWQRLFDIDNIKCVRINSIGHIYVVSGNGLFKSKDSGKSWQKISYESFIFLEPHPIDSLLIYATRKNYYLNTEEFLISRDAGRSWEILHDCKNANSLIIQKVPLVIDSHFPNIIYWSTSTCGVLKSCDSGLNWTKLSNGLANSNVISLTIDPNNSRILFCGTSEGEVYRYIHCSSSPFDPIVCSEDSFGMDDFKLIDLPSETKLIDNSDELSFLEWFGWTYYTKMRDSTNFQVKSLSLVNKSKYITADVSSLDSISLMAIHNLIIHIYRQTLEMNDPKYSLVYIYRLPDNVKKLDRPILSVSTCSNYSPLSLKDIESRISSLDLVVEFTLKNKKFLLGLGEYTIYPQASEILVITLIPKSVRFYLTD
ncbi:MAG: hypothetical protein JXC36_04535 [Candidatus Atribacteria bacterium]|nr:hypothetical protein [Candidatus Atribacteria bacterium]